MSTNTLASYTPAGITLTTSGFYLSPFTITSAGTILNHSGTAPAVYSVIADPTLLNDGSIKTEVGVKLTDGGTVINNASIGGAGTSYTSVGFRFVSGLVDVNGSPAVVINTGTIAAFYGDGVELQSGGFVSNSSSGDIYGFFSAIYVSGAAATIVNDGRLGADTEFGAVNDFQVGVELEAGGTLINHAGALISGNLAGIDLSGSPTLYNAGTIEDTGLAGSSFSSGILGVYRGGGVTISNIGTILAAGTAGEGLRLFGGGLVSNASSSALILGAQAGVYSATSAVTVVNAGTILATASGASGIYLGSGGTVVNAGTISGPGAALVFQGTAGNQLVVEPGAVFSGAVEGSASASNALELAAGTGSITGIGTQFTQFGSITFDPGASWTSEGDAAGLASGQTISGFAAGDTIILDGFTEASFSYVTGAGLEISDGATTDTLDIAGTFDTGSFSLTPVAEGTEVSLCYLRGTRIMSPSGEVPVEALRIGDPIVTRFGGTQRIKWIGRQSFAPAFAWNNSAKIPVRIAAAALAPGVPKRDLYISPGHSMLLGGILVLAEALVNGVTITQDWAGDEIHYVQLEFENHDCVLAEGAWSESFADGPGMRGLFHNAGEYYEMFPGYREPDEFKMCAPRPEAGAALEAALRPVLGRAGGRAVGPLQGWIDHADGEVLEGWAVDSTEPNWPVSLEVLLGDWVLGKALACGYREDLANAGFRQGWCRLLFPLPENLPLSARRNLRVRRAGGLLGLPMTAECLQDLGLAVQPWRLAG
jgi:hypothetical protein